ncbi:MAG: mechanosensitive ion channel domain-containing protein, partial [Desulfohalobiaceae bacterium]
MQRSFSLSFSAFLSLPVALLGLLLLAVIASVSPTPASAQQDAPGIGNEQEVAKPSSMSSKEVNRAIRILENGTKRKELLQDLKAISAADNSTGGFSAASQDVGGWSWWGLGSWLGSKAENVQRMLQSREGRIKLLRRTLLTLGLFLFAGGGWYFIRRRMTRFHISSRTTLAVVRLFAGGLVLFLLLSIWGVNLSRLLLQPVVMAFSRSVAVVLLVIALGTAAWEIFNFYLRKQAEKLDSSALSGRRMQTLLPLLRNVARIVIIVVCLLIIMSELGVNIAPLLAGAGIIGLAVGFGAQTLVKDLINGFLILAENAINVGDWVILGGHDGQVESLSIRNVRVRDIYGNMNIVPWSSVETVVNQTMGHGWAVVEPGVAYRENIDEVIEVVQEVAAEMRRDPAINQDILSDLQILGLIELGDSAVVVRTRFKTTPFRRWFLERDFRRRLKKRFDELGIEIPYPHSTVYFGEDKQGSASPARIEVVQRGDSG